MVQSFPRYISSPDQTRFATCFLKEIVLSVIFKGTFSSQSQWATLVITLTSLRPQTQSRDSHFNNSNPQRINHEIPFLQAIQEDIYGHGDYITSILLLGTSSSNPCVLGDIEVSTAFWDTESARVELLPATQE